MEHRHEFPPHGSSSARILIVDDDSAARAGLAEWLGYAGYTCITAGSFEEAMSVLRSAPPDLLITDIRLGAMNGLQLVIHQAGATPAIVITGFADSILEMDAIRAGAVYMTKPLVPHELLAQVKVALAGRRPDASRERHMV